MLLLPINVVLIGAFVMQNNSTAIVILNNNFRLYDNLTLYHACSNYSQVVLVYIQYNNYANNTIPQAYNVFLYNVLQQFTNNLKKFNAKLNCYIANNIAQYTNIVQTLASKFNCSNVIYSNTYNNNVFKHLTENLTNIKFTPINDKLLFIQQQNILNNAGEHFKVFSHYAKSALNYANTVQQAKTVSSINALTDTNALCFSQLNLLPVNQGNWHQQIAKHYTFNQETILKNYTNFVNNNLQHYATNRNYMALNGTANISAYLNTGLLSIRTAFILANNYTIANNLSNQFVLELLWREFAYYSYNNYNNLFTQEIKPLYANFKWEDNPVFLKKWQTAQTGVAIVDAGMQQLYQTGYMHNRVRMITASFLIKNLHINWRLGEQWFFNTLVDADSVVNAFSWQWVFGSGLDSAPYFRIFNPQLQQNKFDATQEYINKWLPANYNISPIVDSTETAKIAQQKYKDTLM